ncbi:DUF1015 family protein [Streptomyces sp. B-S-A12]|uniref:DUF1015 family protein n=1 Tax=Streptomyces luteolus TaxID=3043615 RepID=A0ABT6SZ62_9ACTN|nr:DUF1015 family protein [Streptomyces sp. B-S-A12]MDI3420888.1 DUF1015 family protein [Streptomyces sp. B-S-A12]
MPSSPRSDECPPLPCPALPASTALQLSPFHGVRYDARRIGDISATVCPPYDDIGPARVRNLRSRPHHIAQLLHDSAEPASQRRRHGPAAERRRRAASCTRVSDEPVRSGLPDGPTR